MVLERLLSSRQITSETGISRATIYRLSRNGEFPQALKIGPRGLRWKESAIRDWIETRDRPE